MFNISLYSTNEIAIAALLLSGLSFLVALGSLAVSYINLRRDRTKLSAHSTFYSKSSTTHAKVAILMTNVGRRPLGLASLIKMTENGDYESVVFIAGSPSINLTEGQKHEIVWNKQHLTGGPPNTPMHFVDLYIEDSHGHRYQVKNARKNLAKLRKS